MNTVPFDFDRLAKLYQENPEAFEREREDTVQAFLDSVPKERQEGLQKLQWRIDAERHRCRSTTGLMVSLHKMMFDELYTLSVSLETLKALLNGDRIPQASPMSKEAKILPFSKKKI